MEPERNDDIAIVGMSCRFPIHCNEPSSFWDFLVAGGDGITSTDARWANDVALPTTKHGGFVDDVESFDSAFFRILPIEAIKMDPQQRILLELHWEALESACIVPSSLKESNTGVYVGLSWHDYEVLSYQSQIDKSMVMGHHNLYLTTGTTPSMASGRVSFFFDTRGPSLTLDTACSSSLTCVHLGCQSLQSRETDLVLASGVTLNLSPDISTNFTRANMMGDRCRAFDANASGYVRSEGCGVVVLKRQADAIRDGNRIIGLIKATSLSQDGADCVSITAPSTLAQQQLMRQTLEKAGLQPRDVQYIEAHGTGTRVGDKAELNSIVQVFGCQADGGNSANLIGIGSVKTNIGHTETAAGLAGLFKILLALQHQFIPKHLHFTKLPPGAPKLQELGLEILQNGKPWPLVAGAPRLAALSSFGFSGSLAHAIIAEPPIAKVSVPSIANFGILTLSAKTKTSLDGLLERYRTFFRKHESKHGNRVALEDKPWLDVAYTTNIGREHFPQHRAAIVISSSTNLATILDQSKQVFYGSSSKLNPPKSIRFIFGGTYDQSLVSAGMEFFKVSRTFQEMIHECERHFNPFLSARLSDFIFDIGNVNHKMYQEIVVFSIEYSMAQMYIEYGVLPSLCECYGLVGKIAGACIGGSLEFKDVCQLVAALAGLKQVEKYQVLLIMNISQDLLATIEEVGVGIAEWNTKKDSLMLHGKSEQIRKICDQLTAGEHKIVMEFSMPTPGDKQFLELVKKIRYMKPKNVELLCGLTDRQFGLMDDSFWTASHLRGTPAKREAETREYNNDRNTVNIVINANQELLRWKNQESSQWLPSSNEKRLYENLALLYSIAHQLNFTNVHKGQGLQLLDLPKYSFDKKKYWYPSTPLVRAKTKHVGFAIGTKLMNENSSNEQDASLSVLVGQPKEVAALNEIEGGKRDGAASSAQTSTGKSAVEISTLLLNEIQDSAPTCWPQNVQQYENMLEDICLLHIVKAFVKLGIPNLIGSAGSIELNKLAANASIASKQFVLFEHFVSVLTKAGYLAYKRIGNGEGGSVSIESSHPATKLFPSVDDVQSQIDMSIKAIKSLDPTDTPNRWILMEIANHCGKEMSSILRGETDSLKYLFASAAALKRGTAPPARMEDFYARAPELRQCNEILEKIIASMEIPQPNFQVKILEIGAGTGSATTHILAALHSRSIKYELHFTDLSRAFFFSSKAKLNTGSNVIYKLLNIEEDPLAQGFDPNCFDIVVGSNVIHATKNIRHSLENIKKVLRPGGYLILCEYIQPMLALDCVFGTLGGWWMFKGHDNFRPNYPLLDPSLWTHMYETSGFEDVRCIGFPAANVVGRLKSGGGADGLKMTKSQVHQILLDIIVKVTGLAESEIENDKDFAEFGLNSMMTVELRSRLQARFELEFPAEITRIYPTINLLAKYIVGY